MKIPDLLFNEASVRLDENALKEVLGFAFATGKAPHVLESFLEDQDFGKDSEFDPSCFATDLFLRDFVADCFVLEGFHNNTPLNREYLFQQLCHPPSDPEVITFRQGIMAELAQNEEMYFQFKKLYAALRQLVWAFDTSSFGVQLDLTEFRMTIIHQILIVIDLMAGSFEKAGSGLGRINEAGHAMIKTTAYQELRDLVDYEDHLSSVDVRIRVGAAGDLRAFSVIALAENSDNRFYSTPWGRVREKMKLWLRGYRFRDADLVGSIVENIYKKLEDQIVPFVQLLGQVEFYLVSMSFRSRLTAMGLPSCLPQFSGVDESVPVVYENLFNPLLLQQEVMPVPCTLKGKWADAITLVTGPNSGGKTRLLQALGITQLLGQNGLYVPAGVARLRIAHGMFASLRELEAVDSDEGRLGQELARIHTAFRKSPYGAMLLLDELCSGTNPSEGCEIVSLVLEMLAGLRPQAFITTHFLDYVRRLFAAPPLAHLDFLQVELSPAERPTYQFVPGVARSSLARRIADRLGVSREELEALVQQKVARVKKRKPRLIA